MKIKNEILKIIRNNNGITKEEIFKLLNLPKNEKIMVTKVIDSLIDDKLVFLGDRDLIFYGFPEEKEGKFYKKGNYGFINYENEKYFVPPSNILDAQNGDEVRFIIIDEGNKVAKVLKVVSYQKKYFIGFFKKKKKNFKFYLRNFSDIKFKLENKNNLPIKENLLYCVEIIKYNNKKKSYTLNLASIVETHHNKIDLVELSMKYGRKPDFDKDILKKAKILSEEEITLKNRVDYRDLITFTIDGDDAKDFDDAISISSSEDGYILYVHIADVSHYVKHDSKIDIEAKKRQMSVYLPGLVIPMLPNVLSDYLCSLMPNQDRYTLSAKMFISKNGDVKLLDVCEALINSNERLTYNNVNEYYENGTKIYNDEIYKSLDIAKECFLVLKKRAIDNGYIDFFRDEAKFILDKDNKIIDIIKRPDGISENLIEMFMILTNNLISEFFTDYKVPFIYRVHPKPEIDDILSLNDELKKINLSLSIEPESKDYSFLLEKAKLENKLELVSDLLLRSMQKAYYSNEPSLHFALNLDKYSHFTSPIRRYPDLFIHRVIKDILNNKKTNISLREAEEVSHLASRAEKEIVELEREAVLYKKCEYLQDKIGNEYIAKVTSINEFGIFIVLENTISGAITSDVNNLAVGDKIIVILEEVDMKKLHVNFRFKEKYYGK